LSPAADSSDLHNVQIAAQADTNADTILDASDVVFATTFRLTGSPTSGPPGTDVSWTIIAAIPPVAFDATTSAEWSGRYEPPTGPVTQDFSTTYTPEQVHESSASDGILLVGDGTFSNQPDVSSFDGGGTLLGQITFQFGAIPFRRAFDYTVDTDVAAFEMVTYPAGPGGLDPPQLDGAWQGIPVLGLSQAPDPNAPSEALLATLDGFHVAVVVRIADNTTAAGEAPNTMSVDVLSFDENQVEIDRLTGLTLNRVPGGAPGTLLYHNDLNVPLILVDVELDDQQFPNVRLIRAAVGGSALILPAE
jgi:hypothetical protein